MEARTHKAQEIVDSTATTFFLLCIELKGENGVHRGRNNWSSWARMRFTLLNFFFIVLNICNIKFDILTILSAFFSGINYIHNAVQLSLLFPKCFHHNVSVSPQTETL